MTWNLEDNRGWWCPTLPSRWPRRCAAMPMASCRPTMAKWWRSQKPCRKSWQVKKWPFFRWLRYVKMVICHLFDLFLWLWSQSSKKSQLHVCQSPCQVASSAFDVNADGTMVSREGAGSTLQVGSCWGFIVDDWHEQVGLWTPVLSQNAIIVL